MLRRGETREERFWFWVNKRGPNGCWEWSGARFWTGYGLVSINGKTVTAHRYAWQITKGPIPEGLLVLHKCNNKICVNPEHLYIGDYGDNMADRINSGSSHRDEKRLLCKLYDEEVQLVRKLLEIGGLTYEAIGRMFKVSQFTIYRIKHDSNFLTRGSAGGEL